MASFAESSTDDESYPTQRPGIARRRPGYVDPDDEWSRATSADTVSSNGADPVDPLIPLALLQAVREADRPTQADEAEYVPEFLNKRLGTTDTVYAQIRRYTEAVRRNQPVPFAEVVGLSRLIGRRPDAERVFQLAGASTARSAYAKIGAPVRGMIRILPRIVARPLARRQAKKIVRRYFAATLERYGADFRMRLPADRAVTARIHTVTASATLGDSASSYYDSGLQELLTLLTLRV